MGARHNHYIEMYAFSREIVRVGSSLRAIIAHRNALGLLKVDPDAYCRNLLKKLSSEETIHHTMELADGRVIQVISRSTADGGWVAIHSDITERINNERSLKCALANAERAEREAREAQDRLSESERNAREIVASALDGFIQVDDAGFVRDWNRQAEAIFGWGRNEVMAQPIDKFLISTDDKTSIGTEIMTYVSSGSSRLLGRRVEVQARRRDGQKINVELSVTVRKRQKRYIFNGFVRDLTAKIAAEEQLRQAQKMEAVGKLTGGLAHDFNNLLSVMIGNLDLVLEMSNVDVETRKKLEIILQAGERGAELTKRMLAYARRQPLSSVSADLNSVIRSVVQLLDRTIGDNITINLQLATHPVLCRVDIAQLETAIINIAINARDAMPNGGMLTIETRLAKIEDGGESVSGLNAGTYCLVKISDTGTGMPTHVVDRIFEPFYTTKDAGVGTGLGLSMVYGFMKQSGGQVSVESEVDVGTTFSLYLPAERSDDSRVDTRESGSLGHFGVDVSNTVILALDDNPVVREVLVNQLKALGYGVVEASDAAAALDVLSDGQKVDLLLTDVMMPGGLSGKDLARIAKEEMPGLKILFTSGFPGSAASHEIGLEEGDLLLSKPYRRQQLVDMVNRALAG